MRRRNWTASAVAVVLVAGPLAAQEGAPEAAADGIVVRAVVASDVQDREPVGVDTMFTADVGTLYFYTVFEGDFAEMTIEHVWMHEGEEIARVPLTVQGPRWRTWSSKEILPEWTGSWTVKVLDAEGNEHASVEFSVAESM